MAESLEALDEVEFEGDSDLLIASRDFDRIANTRINAGYLEGIECGKQQGLEEGFHHGFKKGLECSVQWSVLRGNIRALQAHCSTLAKKQDTSPSSIYNQINVQLNELLEVVRDREKRWKERSLAEETKDYQQRSRLAEAKVQKASVGGSLDSIVLKDLLSAKEACPELQEFLRRLEHLRSQIT